VFGGAPFALSNRHSAQAVLAARCRRYSGRLASTDSHLIIQMRSRASIGIAAVVLAVRGVSGVTNPEEYVNTLGGTDSRYDLSHGNLLPLVNRPWSFNAWAPMTDNSDGSWWFHPTDARFFGIRCTHQVGRGHG
jgi:putative alpha-1,2-mannosidase